MSESRFSGLGRKGTDGDASILTTAVDGVAAADTDSDWPHTEERNSEGVRNEVDKATDEMNAILIGMFLLSAARLVW